MKSAARSRFMLLVLVAAVVALLVIGLLALDMPLWLVVLGGSSVGGTLAAMVLGRADADCDPERPSNDP
ncbi:MAG TPA: hypothetical protein VHH15_16110 [Actinophytocola sp.]|nr:hypothetical protein [Actinophytocola sp.]